eukprot:gene11172-14991_t
MTLKFQVLISLLIISFKLYSSLLHRRIYKTTTYNTYTQFHHKSWIKLSENENYASSDDDYQANIMKDNEVTDILLISTLVNDTNEISSNFTNTSSTSMIISSQHHSTTTGNPKMNLLDKFKSLISGNGWNGQGYDKSLFAKLGLNLLLAYGFVSNISYITCLILAWISFGRSTGLSPLAPGQWKKYLLIYSGFWAANNVIRPARFSLSLLISPLFNNMIEFIHNKTGYKKTAATLIVIFTFNILLTTSYLLFGLYFATKLAKVPFLASN